VIGTAITMTTGNITGNLTVGGVLTYDDVTNVDSIGVVTARSGIKVVGGGVSITAGGFNVTAGFSTYQKNLLVVPSNPSLGNLDEVGVGIGTTNVAYRLTVVEANTQVNFGTASDVGGFLMSPSDGEFGISGGARFNGSNWNARHTSGSIVRHDGSGNLLFFTNTGLTKGDNFTPSERLRITSVGEVRVGSAFSVGQAGIVTAAEYHGDGSNLTGIAVGLSTAAAAVAGIVTTLDLSSAQDHKLTVSGISTITVKGGTEGESHTVRIINSGITTVGFSTFFLFPSGADPSMPTADGAISLISFTVNRVGAGGTQLLAGAALNYS
jgi:hypothetical protein